MDLLTLDIRLIFAILNGKVSAAINKKLTRHFHEAGIELSPEQWIVLLYLTAQDGVTQQHLCNATFKDKPAMTRLIDMMEKAELVVRTSSRTDRRVNLIFLTAAGRLLKEKSQTIALRTLKEALRGLGIDELRVSQEVLRQVFKNTMSS